MTMVYENRGRCIVGIAHAIVAGMVKYPCSNNSVNTPVHMDSSLGATDANLALFLLVTADILSIS